MTEENKPAGGSGDDEGTPPVKEERTFSQAELDAIVQKRLAKERKTVEELRAKLETKQEPKATPPSRETPTGVSREEFDQLRSDMAFADAVSRMAGADKLTDRQRAVLRKEFDPSNPATLRDTAEELFGIGKVTEEKQVMPEEKLREPTQPDGVGRYIAPGAPSSAPREESSNPLEWTKDDVARLRSQRAANGRSLFLEKLDEWAARTGGSSVPFANKFVRGPGR